MKKKGPRAIPDFGRHQGRDIAPGATPRPDKSGTSAPRTAAPRPAVKPQATSAKSGQRGQ